MLVVQPKRKIAARYFRNEAGKLVRAYFLVAEYQGRLFFKLLKVEPVAGDFNEPAKQVLPIIFKKAAYAEYRQKFFAPIVSPFLNIFDFFVSQPTRAPSAVTCF